MQSTAAPRDLFDEAIDLISAGELGAAEFCCREALDRYPGDVNMQALLGALLVKMERRLEAEVQLRKVIEAAPSFAKPIVSSQASKSSATSLQSGPSSDSFGELTAGVILIVEESFLSLPCLSTIVCMACTAPMRACDWA